MKRIVLIFAITLIFVLTACGAGTQTPAAIPTVSLDTGPAQSGGRVTASAEAIPVLHVKLSFPLTGVVTSVEVQEGDLVEAGDVLVTLDTAILASRVKEAEANLAVAQTQVDYLRRVKTANDHIEKAIAEVDRAQAILDSARATLAQAELSAPIGGTVVRVDASAGETVTPGQVIIEIGDLTHMRIETTDLSERDVPRIKVGQKASVYIEALDREINGTVVEIDQQAGTVGGDVVFKVTIELDEQPQDLRWGMSAEVRIQVDG
jgi:HlyD family secretion protein